MLLLADWRQNTKTVIFELHFNLDGFLAVAHLDGMEAAGFDFVQLGGDRVVPLSREPVDAGPDQEMRAEIVGEAEQLESIGS
jgi:hypothetical protein